MQKKQNKLKLIRVKPEYIKYLRQYDKKVQLNSKEIHKENKPFVGVLFQINKFEYFVPISSNKKEKVQLNSKEIHKENKPFVGVLFQINKFEYFVPISSNKKEKLVNMFQNYLKTNQKPIDIFFVEEISVHNQRKLLSVLNINNMIPIVEEAKIDFNIEKDKDFSLLRKEIDYCNKHRREIVKNSIRIYNAVIRHEWESLEKRCCNFKLLEEKCIKYKK